MKLLTKTFFKTLTRSLILLMLAVSMMTSLALAQDISQDIAQEDVTPLETLTPSAFSEEPTQVDTQIEVVEETDVTFPETITISPLSIYNEGVSRYNNEDYETAIEKFEELLALPGAPNQEKAIDLLSRSYTRHAYYLEENVGDFTSAEQHYRLAIENFAKLAPPYEQMIKRLYSFAHNRLGVLIYSTEFDAEDSTTDNALKEAFRNFNNAININKENSSAYNNKGIAYSAQGDSRPAIASFTKAIEYNENNAIAYLNRGTDHFFINDLNAALSDFKEVIRYQVLSDMIADPEEAEQSLLYAKEMLGFTYLALGNSLYHESLFESAIDNYTQALVSMDELGSDAPALLDLRPSVHLYLGTTYAQVREFTKATSELESAIALNPNYADALNNLGIVHYEVGNFEKAVSTYTEAIEKNPRLAEAYLNRGNAYNQLGMSDAAQSDYEMATQLGLDVFTYFKRVTERSRARSQFIRTHHAYANQALRVKKVPTKQVFIF